MKFLSNKKTIAILIIAILLLSGAYFTLGGFGRSGPDAAPNLAEYGLVGYWNMEEGKGQTVYDRSGNGNNGTLGASTAVAKDDPVFTSGYSSAGAGGTGLKFDGVNDYVDAGNAASLNITGAITIEAWVKANNLSANQVIISKSKYGSNLGSYELAFSGSNLRLILSQTGVYNSSFDYTSTQTISTNVWTHVVGVYTGTNVTLYANGVALTHGKSTFPTSIYSSTANNYIGARPEATPERFFNGTIDEVRIYNRALSADEIRQHYNQKKPILEWKFDEGSGTTVHDESFNSNDGTLHE